MVAEFIRKCWHVPEVELQDLILRNRKHIISDLARKRNIVHLAKLLVCSDKKFRTIVFKKLKEVISNMDNSFFAELCKNLSTKINQYFS